jgi:hypothetical protein
MVLALAFGGVVALSAWSDAAVLYAADGSGGHLSSLVVLNPNTGAVTSVVGPIGFAVTGLAIHPLTGLLALLLMAVALYRIPHRRVYQA